MRTATQLNGILPALITPFTEDGASVDETALTSLVQGLVQAGVGGLIPCGSTGEFTALSTAERKRVTEVIVQAAEGTIPVVPHTGALTTKETIELSTHAEQSGAAAVMVVPPFYESPGWSALVDHYGSVASAISIPIMIYNIPSASGVPMTAEDIAELAGIEGVAYLKDSSGDAVLLTRLLQGYTDRIEVLNGWDSLTFYGLAAGAKASVWGAANFIPELAVELCNCLTLTNELEKARAIWAKIWPICEVLETTAYVGAVKTACHLLGIASGPTRAPAQLLAEGDKKRLASALEAAGLVLA
jgi:4-hydroxy-tetrahydrodipicolinate synthase